MSRRLFRTRSEFSTCRAQILPRTSSARSCRSPRFLQRMVQRRATFRASGQFRMLWPTRPERRPSPALARSRQEPALLKWHPGLQGPNISGLPSNVRVALLRKALRAWRTLPPPTKAIPTKLIAQPQLLAPRIPPSSNPLAASQTRKATRRPHHFLAQAATRLIENL